MNNLDPQLNILWLSDIHYDENYSDKQYHSELKKYLDSFKLYLKNLDVEYDYILLSGDIAQNGDENDYNLFYIDILKDILELFPNAKLLVIPGNHDVSRNGVSFINEFIENKESRDTFLKKHRDDFYKIFAPFSNQFINNSSISMDSSITYKEHLLYGYVLDKKNKTIIILLNSSWYSVGDIFLTHYINNDFHNTREAKLVIHDIKKITSEYGFQTLGLDVLAEIDGIIEILNNYPEYLTITTMHHPINWFIHKDQITRDEYKFHQIKKFTDLLLTGHEHISVEHPFEYINNGKILHIKAGCFMDFSKENKELNGINPFKINNNWFSTLEINTKKRTVRQDKHYYDTVNNEWVEYENKNISKLNKKNTIQISENRLNNIKGELKNNSLKIVQHLFKDDAIREINQSVYRYKKNIIFFTADDFINISHNEVKDLFQSENFEKLYVVFVDLFNNISEKYTIANDRLLVLNTIKNDYDFKFNIFRHDFFSNLTKDEVINYGNLAFIAKIVPYWDIEHLNC